MRLSLGSADSASRSRSAPAASRPSCPLAWCLARYQLLLCQGGSQEFDWGGGARGLAETHLPQRAQALRPPLTSQASRMVTTSPLWKASSPGLGRVCSHLVMHWVPGAQRL